MTTAPVQASTFGNLLRTLRRAAGLTLEQLAERSGISTRAISDMERGHSRAPQARTLAALADGLGLDSDARAGLTAAAKEARSPSAAGRPRLCEPPRGVTDFVGRQAEFEIVRQAAIRAVEGDDLPPVLVVHGQPGLGKTALALWAANELRDDFPDGCLYVDLRGVDAVPLPAGDALLRLLRALGIRPHQVADSDDERCAQLRGILRDRRCVLVLDNAGSRRRSGRCYPRAAGASSSRPAGARSVASKGCCGSRCRPSRRRNPPACSAPSPCRPPTRRWRSTSTGSPTCAGTCRWPCGSPGPVSPSGRNGRSGSWSTGSPMPVTGWPRCPRATPEWRRRSRCRTRNCPLPPPSCSAASPTCRRPISRHRSRRRSSRPSCRTPRTAWMIWWRSGCCKRRVSTGIASTT
ncbi:helix-turn-helix domain-containing protein [Catellatospora coxensis]